LPLQTNLRTVVERKRRHYLDENELPSDEQEEHSVQTPTETPEFDSRESPPTILKVSTALIWQTTASILRMLV
jgi:hypothetical protein